VKPQSRFTQLARDDWQRHLLNAEIRPTPKPAKKRPAMKRGCSVDAVCRITPKLKTMPAETIRPKRRPRRSPNGAAVSAPKNVPADKMDTIREFCDAGSIGLPSASLTSEKFSSQYGMANIPEMVPVSYLQRSQRPGSSSYDRVYGPVENTAESDEETDDNGWPTIRQFSVQRKRTKHKSSPRFARHIGRLREHHFDHFVVVVRFGVAVTKSKTSRV
jgi:hypothetical protein